MLTTLCGIFFLSGAAALIFETIWFRLAGLSLGSSVWASSIVLAAFMGGLALGNWLAAAFGTRLRRPLRSYAWLEILVGAFGLAAVLALPRAAFVLRAAVGVTGESGWLLQAVRLSVAFVLMLVPAAAMGMTLPVLASAVSRVDGNFGRILGRLYGWNTLGGVAGALAGETLLIRSLGLRGAALVAASLDVVAAAVALTLASRLVVSSGELRADVDPPRAAKGHRELRLLAAAALAGALVLALEVAWFRLLQLYVNGTALAFAAMLAVVLFGIALGGLAAGRWFAARPAVVGFVPTLSLLAGIVTALGYVMFAPPSPSGSPAGGELRTLLVLAASLMLPTTVLSGVLFTCLGRELRTIQRGVTETAGRLTLANTIGAMAGALLGGFALLPALGVERSLYLLSLAYAAVAILAWRQPLGRAQRLSLGGAGAVFLIVFLLFPFGLMKNHFVRRALGRFVCPGATRTAIVFYREGLNETVSILSYYWGDEPLAHRLVTNGQSMAADSFYSRRYMKLYAYWAAAVKPDAKRALLISYGLGNTASALRDVPWLTRVDVVDISRDVLDAGDALDGEQCPLRDPRFRTHVEDGRFFLQTTREEYDLITAEPPPPRLAGVVNLYSREFFELALERLRPGGIVTYWLPIHQLTTDEARSTTRGFCDAFPNCSLWRGSGEDWMLAGSRGALRALTETEFVRIWADRTLGANLTAIGVEDPTQLGALFIADGESLAAWIGGAPPLVDDRPGLLASGPPTDAERAVTWEIAQAPEAQARHAFEQSPFVRSIWPENVRRRTSESFVGPREYDDAVRQRKGVSRISLVHRVLTQTSLRVLPMAMLDSEPSHQEISLSAARTGRLSPQFAYHLGIRALAERRYVEAVQLFEIARSIPAAFPRVGLLHAFALGLAGRSADGLRVLRSSTRRTAEDPEGIESAWLERFLVGHGAAHDVVGSRDESRVEERARASAGHAARR